MFCGIYREIAVATRLLVSLLKAPQVHVETAMARERLRQIKADFPVLSIQPGGELRDQAVGPSPCLLTMPSQLPLLDESAPSILADGLLCASDFLQVGAGKLLTKLNKFHISENIVVDIMHDLSEGVAVYILRNVIESLIKENIFSLKLINDKIETF